MPTNIQPFDAVKNPSPELGQQPGYIGQMIHAAFAARPSLPQDDPVKNAAAGFPNQPDIPYWTGQVQEKPSWGAYWWDRIIGAFGNASGGSSGGGGSVAGTGGNAGTASTEEFNGVLTAQLGLLEDDIAYRLALLCANVLQPLKDVYPNIVITSGFRQTNSGIGQHEKGEAVDLQIRNQTPELLYEVADFIHKNLQFDQLVLNFTQIGKKEPWIHVSFSPDSLRGQVLTKDFADNFHDGLFLVDPLVGEDAAQALRDQQTQDTAILAEMTNIQTRQGRLGQGIEVVPDDTVAGDAGGGAGGSGGGGGSGDAAHIALVACVRDALVKAGMSMSAGNPAFEITKRVAWLLQGEHAGFFIKPAGENVVQWNGYPLSASRLCFPNGQLVKVVSDAGPNGHNGPTYDFEDIRPPASYVPAMDPGTDITMDWTVCSLGGGPAADANTAPSV